MSLLGTVVRGVRAPIIRNGDNLIDIVCRSVLDCAAENNIKFNDRDIVGVTEAVVAKSQGNYATVEQIAQDVSSKFPNKTVGLLFPILSRNRFSLLLKGISQGVDKLIIQLSYPSDEVGNPLIDPEIIYSKKITLDKCFTDEEFAKIFGNPVHPFTGVNYIDYYKQITGGKCEIILSNNISDILKHTKYVINADIHTRKRTKSILYEHGAEKVVSLDEILNKSVNGSGYNGEYGILGSNLATDGSVKLFPRDCQPFVDKLSEKLSALTGKKIECLVYGDGAFKDPVGKIWELADPVVSPAYTKGLEGTPNEMKFKYIADNEINALKGEEADKAIKELIKNKKSDLVGNMSSQGTTPRRLTDLIGSLCDLTSGSGDKGTPIIWIQGYFNNYSVD